MIVYLQLSGFYVCTGSFSQAAHPVVVVKDKAVLDANGPASARGIKVGMTLREAKAILHDGKFVEWEPDEYREAQRRWLDVCTEFTDVVEPEEQHTAYLDLSMHPDPGDVLQRLVGRLRDAGSGIWGLGSGVLGSRLAVAYGTEGRALHGCGVVAAGCNVPAAGSETRDEGRGTRDQGSGNREQGADHRALHGRGAVAAGCNVPASGSETRDEGRGTRDQGSGNRELESGQLGNRATGQSGSEAGREDVAVPSRPGLFTASSKWPQAATCAGPTPEGPQAATRAGPTPEGSKRLARGRRPREGDVITLDPGRGRRISCGTSDLQSPALSVGAARVKWMAKAALLAGDTSHLAYRYPKLFLSELPTTMLAPVAPEHRERLCFLGYKYVGKVAELPLDVLQAQFGEGGMSIHRAAHGGVVEKVQALYPLRCASARFSFESPVESTEVLERGLSQLARRLSAQLRESDLQGCELRVHVGFEEGPEETLRRQFAKPMQSAASVSFGLKLTMDSHPNSATNSPGAGIEGVSLDDRCHPDRSEAVGLPRCPWPGRDLTGVDSRFDLNPVARSRFPSDSSTSLGMTDRDSAETPSIEPQASDRRIVSLRVQMPNLTRATRRQGDLYTLRSQERLGVAETAFDQMRKTFGTDAVLSAAQMPEPRRKRVLRAWKDAVGWT